MKRFSYILTAIILIVFVRFELSAQPVESSYGGQTKFKIVLLGTRHRSDIESIIRSLMKSPLTERIVPTAISQDRLEYEGTYTGSEQSFVADIRGLAMNRFNINESRGSGGEVLITLRKIQPVAAPAAPPEQKSVP